MSCFEKNSVRVTSRVINYIQLALQLRVELVTGCSYIWGGVWAYLCIIRVAVASRTSHGLQLYRGGGMGKALYN